MITIRFTNGRGLSGAIVRWATWSRYGHVGFKFDNNKVLDATPDYGVSYRDAVDDDSTEYWRILAPHQKIEAAAAWAMTQIGKPYDWAAICGWAWRKDWHNDKAWDCSELICAAFDSVNCPLVRSDGLLTRITPRDLRLSERIAPVRVAGRELVAPNLEKAHIEPPTV